MAGPAASLHEHGHGVPQPVGLDFQRVKNEADDRESELAWFLTERGGANARNHLSPQEYIIINFCMKLHYLGF